MKLQHVLAGSAAFAASVYSGYMYAKPMKALPQTAATAADEASGSCAFDRLAGVYDSIIGSEERYMFYGLLRWWLLRDAQVCGSVQSRELLRRAWHLSLLCFCLLSTRHRKQHCTCVPYESAICLSSPLVCGCTLGNLTAAEAVTGGKNAHAPATTQHSSSRSSSSVHPLLHSCTAAIV
jgi:hypothetical protein